MHGMHLMRDFWGIKKPELAVDSVRLIYRFNPLPAVRQGDTTTNLIIHVYRPIENIGYNNNNNNKQA